MTRRDRAACVLALECSRDKNPDCITTAMQVLAYGGPIETWIALRRVILGEGLTHVVVRLVRARLALYLRALLRADAGDCGRVGMRCSICGANRGQRHCRCCAVHQGSVMCSCWGAWKDRPALFTPLWQLAGATRER